MSKPSTSEPDIDSDKDSAELLAGSVVESFNLVQGSTNVDDVLNAEFSPSMMSRQNSGKSIFPPQRSVNHGFCA